jgi:hypothetical protein
MTEFSSIMLLNIFLARRITSSSMQTFASWDVDYLKNDNCGNCKYGYSNTPAKQVTRMGDALRRWGAEGSGRPIFATRHVRVTISHHRGRAFCTSSMLAQSMSISRVSAITTTTTCWKWGMENSRMRRSARTSQYGALSRFLATAGRE